MEKKVIDLRNCKEDVEIIYPINRDMIKGIGSDYSTLYIRGETDPFDLAPKSLEELEERLNGRTYTQYRAYAWCATEKDREAFEALSELRVLWHEWVKALGEATPQEYCTIHYFRESDSIDISYTTMGILSFKEIEHAKKFIECFYELLDKAKILL